VPYWDDNFPRGLNGKDGGQISPVGEAGLGPKTITEQGGIRLLRLDGGEIGRGQVAGLEGFYSKDWRARRVHADLDRPARLMGRSRHPSNLSQQVPCLPCDTTCLGTRAKRHVVVQIKEMM
jgi:hypothetical protein